MRHIDKIWGQKSSVPKRTT